MEKNNNPHENHRSRMRSQLLSGDFGDNTPPHVALEMLLYYSVPRIDTNPLAHRLLDTFGTVDGVLRASAEELCRVDGVGEQTAALIKTVALLERKRVVENMEPIKAFKSHAEMGEYAIKYFYGKPTEHTAVISLKSSGKIIAADKIGDGDLSKVSFTQRKLFETLFTREANAAVLMHNHLSGVVTPSAIDKETTRGLATALSQVSIQLVDHIIVCGNKYFSMASSPDCKDVF